MFLPLTPLLTGRDARIVADDIYLRHGPEEVQSPLPLPAFVTGVDCCAAAEHIGRNLGLHG